jgi:hypothetical protein
MVNRNEFYKSFRNTAGLYFNLSLRRGGGAALNKSNEESSKSFGQKCNRKYNSILFINGYKNNEYEKVLEGNFIYVIIGNGSGMQWPFSFYY